MRIPGHKAIIIMYIFTLGSAGLTTSLFLEGRNYPATGWTIITFVFVFVLVLEKYLRQKETKLKGYEDKLTKNRANAQTKYMENFVVLLSSQDSVKVYAIKDVLSSHNIEWRIARGQNRSGSGIGNSVFFFFFDFLMRI